MKKNLASKRKAKENFNAFHQHHYTTGERKYSFFAAAFPNRKSIFSGERDLICLFRHNSVFFRANRLYQTAI